MNKVLILTASTGAGHNSAAKSLEEEYIKNGYETLVFDIFKDTSEIVDTIVVDGYKVMAHVFPKLYGAIYEMSDRSFLNNRIFSKSMIITRRRLYKAIQNFNPDVIISTHPFAVGIVSALKRKQKIEAKFISIVTDFKAHFAYVTKYVDAYITGSEYTKETLIEKGVDENIIFAYGIPVKSEFYKEEKKDNKKTNAFKILLMGGSLGSKGILKVLRELNINNNVKVIAVCGSNQKLEMLIQKEFAEDIENEFLKVIGFSKEIPKLMDQCDLIITKPGGLTTTEALSKQIPMIIPFAYPGQEIENTEFLVKSGVAMKSDKYDNINTLISILAENYGYYSNMKEQMKNITSEYSIQKIIELSEIYINKDPC
ncbi:glycosyltransferase [Clostridiaceae bacterium HSG29]|nr:glycosyltransferase [Clostridiaceae bacterium HSG29]